MELLPDPGLTSWPQRPLPRVPRALVDELLDELAGGKAHRRGHSDPPAAG